MHQQTRDALEQAVAACADEPIRFSGGIQPHGYLISCDPRDSRVRHVSENCRELFELDPEALIGLPLNELLPIALPFADDLAQLEARFGNAAEYLASINIGIRARFCDVSLHVAQGLAHLEIEPQPQNRQDLAAADLVHDMIFRIGLQTAEAGALHAAVADQVRRLTGFDRVMVYRFLHDDTGEVIAESLAKDVPSYLGLRYPASDIPPQARALYLRNRVRVIADTDYQPSPIVPALHADGGPLDLSLHGLRSVSPVHLEYMRNMGMAASMSISIVVDGRLWGLIACHHRAPRQLPPRHRTAADLLGMFYSLRVASLEHMQRATQKAHSHEIRTRLLHALGSTDAPAELLPQLLDDLREMIPSDAALLVSPDGLSHTGDAVDADTLADARAWLARQEDAAVLATHAADEWRHAASGSWAGLLAMRIGKDQAVLLLRREQVEEVRWAGEPVKHLVSTDDGVRLAPRRSFNSWRETVRGQSSHWDDAALEDAGAATVLLRRALAARQ